MITDWTNDIQGVWYSPKLSNIVRRLAQPLTIFRQLVTPEPNIGPHMGTKFMFTKVGDVRNPGRRIGEHDPVPRTGIPITEDYIEPFEITNSIEFTWWSTLFSELSVQHSLVKALMDDYVRTVDYEAAAEFLKADLVYTPLGNVGSKNFILTTNGVPGAVAERPISAWDIKNIRGLMVSDFRMPPYDGQNLLCIGTYSGIRSLRDDTEFVEAAKYAHPEYLFSGELGDYEGIRFVMENNVLNSRLPGGLGQMVFCAADPVIEIEIHPFEIQAMVSENYGRRQGIRYTNVLGFKKVWDHAKEGHSRLLRVDSLPAWSA